MADPSRNMGSLNRNSFQEDAPPPPYSETDIYSASSRSPRSSLPAISTVGSGFRSDHGPTAPGNDVAFPMSPTSTTGSVIYTPPLTPRTEPTSTTATPLDQSHTRLLSAIRYFETRPPPTSTSLEELRHSIAVKPDSVPQDIPYPEHWAAYDVTPQDWATFVNFLLPDHDSLKNEAIFGGKIKSEDGSDAKSATSNASARSERQTTDPDEWHTRRAEIHSVVHQWNLVFFRPRRVAVILEPEEPVYASREWEVPSNNPSDGVPQAGPSYQRDGMPQRRDGGFQGGWGGLRVNESGVRWGERFVADSNGLRIGNLVMDNRGIRIGGEGAGNRWPPGPEPAHIHTGPPQVHPHLWPRGHPEVNLGPARGRAPHNLHGGARHRPRSCSTSSSSSSDSSVSSSSSDSIGSLPDHDDIKDEQLPFYIARLEQWTANPHEVRSKADVKQLKAELKAGRRNLTPLDPNVDRKELEKQSKTLVHQWRSLKRQQKKEKKERRKAEKKEKRRLKKEMKAARRDHRREQRGCGRGRGRGRGHGVADPPMVPGFPIALPHFSTGRVPHPAYVPGPPPGRGDWGWPGRGGFRG
ncbi:hypothetical protein FLONG3_6362 [Fusarium longipes]|uniref:Uncharacterized protein n=1 Tax=Fusarium longipes TaxID=694270 RepID=A0A395SM00_9HYPO|nr:hypothetical protein FLONG3_6362 [Fusarium longipes]